MYHLTVKKDLILKIESHHPNHAYLFWGAKRDQEEFIENFIENLDIKPVDVFIFDSENKIKIQEIRDLQHQINLKPHSSKYKLVIIRNAGNLTLESSNALLKTLEEPPKNSILVLMAKNQEFFLPTILSRVRKIKIPKSNIEKLSIEDQDFFVSITNMNLREKFDLADRLSKNGKLNIFFVKWLIYLRGELLVGKNVGKLIRKIQKCQSLLKTNINLKLALENILLDTL